ncbi:RICIN domain-containing protein [Kitasatospora sp. NPDC088391]|uniref:RICIN domain-containing protein n=1 Tax=Kitasatospora sp. NPDC088391 TaxID=3364074 RepID=UPI0038004732
MSRRYRGAAALRMVGLTGALALAGGLAVPVAFAADAQQLPSAGEIAAVAKQREQQRPQSETDRALAQAKATGKNVVIESLTTESGETSATPEGHLLLTAAPEQKRVKRDGKWVALDATLGKRADGAFAPRSAAAGVVLSGGGSGPLATLTSADGKKLSISAPFALPAPSVDADGDGLLYPDVVPEVDLKVTASRFGGVSTVLVVKTQQAAAGEALKKLRFATTADGVEIAADKDGALTAKGADGKARWTAPAPTMWDSSGKAPAAKQAAKNAAPSAESAPAPAPAASSADGPGTGATVAVMPVATDAGSLTLTPSQDLLAHGTAPYYIDPAWIPASNTAAAWTWVQSAHPTNAGNYKVYGTGSARPGVGVCGTYPNGGSCVPSDVERSFYEFDTRSLRGAVISSATVSLQEVYSANYACGTTYPVDLYLTGGISNSTSWSTQPGTVGGKLDGTRNVPGTGQSGCSSTVGFDYNVTDSMRQYGTSYDNQTYGVFGNESDAYGFKRLSNNPSLTVTYDRVPDAPANPAVVPSPRTAGDNQNRQSCGNGDASAWGWLGAGASQAQAVALTATVSSPTQGQAGTWSHIWDYNQPGSPDVASGFSELVANNAAASFWLPGGTLQDGHSYGWSLFATDGLNGVGWNGPTPSCFFKVDTTPPTLAFPTTVTDPATQFPPSGSGQTTALRAGQSGSIPFTAADPNPSGLNSSGLVCLRWSFDAQFTGATWQCGAYMPNGQISVTPGRWGTNVLYAQTLDNAGNVSPVGQYAFYVPWNPNGPQPVYGDVNGEQNGARTPDVLTWGPAGDLRAYTAPATGPQNASAATTAQSPGGDSWANYRTTHRGSLRLGPDLDDLLAHKDGDAALWVYKNPGNTGVSGTFDTKTALAKPACAVSTSNPDCTGYATTWATTQQIAALGDPASTDRSTTNQNKNRTGLLTTETAGSDAALWYYPTTTDNTLGAPIRLAASGWKDTDLISPGSWTTQTRPGLWARNRTTGTLTAYPLVLGSISQTDSFGNTYSYPVITGLGTAKTVATNITAAAWPRIGSDGDLTGNGAPSLWAITPQGTLQTWTGTRTGTTADPGYTLTGPNTAYSLDAVPAPAPPSAVEDGVYPGAQNIAATTGATLVRGDGLITPVACDAPHQIAVTANGITLSQHRICFTAPAATGYLALNLPGTTRIETTGRTLRSTLTVNGGAQSTDTAADAATDLGAGTVLQELRITGPATTPATGQNDPATAFNTRLAIGAAGRTCSGALVDPMWVLTARSCFSDHPDNPDDVVQGAPKLPTTATVGRTDPATSGGFTTTVAELVPQTDRDVVLARLQAPAVGITPAAITSTAATNGGALTAAGYGRTATGWGPGVLHTPATTANTVTPTGFAVAPTGSGRICQGDAGGPLWRTENGKPALVGVISRSWQGGCLGAPSTETRTTAQAARTDGLASWVSATAGRSYLLYNTVTAKCADLPGYGNGGIGGAVNQYTCNGTSSDNQRFHFDNYGTTADGYAQYTVRNDKDNLCLDLPYFDGVPSGTLVSEYTCSGSTSDNELYKLVPRPNDGNWLVNVKSGLCLDVDGVRTGGNDARLTVYTCSDTDDHTWQLL